MRKILTILILVYISQFLISCAVPIVAGGAIVTSTNFTKDRRTTGTIIDDKNLAYAAEWFFEENEKLKESHININVFKGSLLLTGEVISKDLIPYAENILRKKYPQIINIFNELRVSKNASLYSISKDSAITSAIILSFQNQEVFNPTHVKVVTENQVVYLLGSVTKREANMAAKKASQTMGVDKVVKLFEYLKQKPQREIDEERRINEEKLRQAKREKKLKELEAKKRKIQKQIDDLN